MSDQAGIERTDRLAGPGPVAPEQSERDAADAAPDGAHPTTSTGPVGSLKTRHDTPISGVPR